MVRPSVRSSAQIGMALAHLVCLALVLAACTTTEGNSNAQRDSSTTSVQPVTTTKQEPEQLPGVGRTIRLGRANWDSGYVHTQIVRDLLEELGYKVEDPADHELTRDLAYQAMAEDDIDLWANSWYPNDLSWWEGERIDGTRVGDYLTRLDESLIAGGGVQGLLVSKSWAETNGVTTLDQIATDERLWSQLDYDEDGTGDIFGCPADWTCNDIIFNNLWCNGWNDVLRQIDHRHDPMGSPGSGELLDQRFQEFIDKAQAGEAAIAYVWTPTHYYALAEPGELTMWLSVNQSSVVVDCSAAEHYAGEEFWQQRGATIGHTDLDPDICLEGPDGCQIGWLASTIEITANQEWLTENPHAHTLLEQIQFSKEEISTLLLSLEETEGRALDLEGLSAAWIADNRSTVNRWLEAATSQR